MQYSIIEYGEVDLDDRMDAEFFKPSYLVLEERLEGRESIPLDEYSSVTASAFYPAASHLYEIGEIPFIRCVDCIDHPVISPLQNDTFERLPPWFVEENSSVKTLQDGDIVITKVGTPCYASVISDLGQVALSRTVLGLRRIRGIDPYYLTAFLRSKYGFQQLYRQRELTIQYQLTLERVRKILVYKPASPELEELIASTLKSYDTQLRVSRQFYARAEGHLLTELGLKDWEPSHRLAFEATFGDIREAKRLDAAYFQPKYKEIAAAIKSTSGGCRRMEEIVSMETGTEPGRDAYRDTGIPFIRVSDLSKFGLDTTGAERISEALYEELMEYQPRQNEILLSKDATPGIAYYLDQAPPKMILCSGILRLRVKDRELINGRVLALILNSLITQQQVEQDAGGAIISHWRLSDIEGTLIPTLDPNTEGSLASQLESSSYRSRVAHQLLGLATTAVELAIEQDEITAINLLKRELRKLDAAREIVH